MSFRSLPLAAAMLFATHVARAQPEQPALHWVRGPAADSCIDPRSLARRVQSITGPSLVSAAAADISIEARIERDSPGVFTLHMRVSSSAAADSGKRVLSFRTDDCRSLDERIAFLIAMAIDPRLGAQGIPPELDWVDENDAWETAEDLRHELATQPAPVASRPAPPRAKPAPPPQTTPPQWQLLAAAAAGNERDAVPTLAGLLALSHALAGQVSLALQLHATAGLRARDLGPARSVTTQSLDAALLACFAETLPARFELAGCAGPDIALLLARGHGFRPDKTAWLTSAGGTLRVTLRRELDARWSVALVGLAQIALLRPAIEYERAGASVRAFRVTPLVVQGGLGVAYAF